MLEETNKALNELKNQNKILAIKKAQKRAKIAKYKKIAKWTLLLGVLLCIFCFPVESGTVIGTWIKGFFGTIYHIVFQ